MKVQRQALLSPGGLATFLSKFIRFYLICQLLLFNPGDPNRFVVGDDTHAPTTEPSTTASTEPTTQVSFDLYWIDLYDVSSGEYMNDSDQYTYSDDDCPFVSDPNWFEVSSLDDCKARCDSWNAKNWNQAVSDKPPCTSIAFDELASDCALRQCLVFPLINAESSSTQVAMGEKYSRYADRLNTKPIQDYFLDYFPLEDGDCLTGETLRRVLAQDGFQTPGSYVCELDGTSDYLTDLPNPDEELPLSYFWDEELTYFDGCWDGMDELTDEYLTYYFAIRLDYEWQEHFYEWENDFKRHGYVDGVDSSFKIALDQASWLYETQFGISVKSRRVALQNSDGSWPENPWRPGDAGVILFTGERSGTTEYNQLCTSKEMTVGGDIFKTNFNNPDYPLYNFEVAETLTHELGHFIGHGHNPVYMPDLMVGSEAMSYRRCDDEQNPGEKEVCTYKSFLSFTDENNYVNTLCSFVRSGQGQCCAVVESVTIEAPSQTPKPLPRACGLISEVSLCPNRDDDCKYKGGVLDWDFYAGCDEDYYDELLRERDDLDGTILSEASRQACWVALQEILDSGLDIQFDPNESCPLNLDDKPPGCFITCNDDGQLTGYFNENAWINIENQFFDAAPVCVRNDAWTSHPTTAPTNSPNTLSPTNSPTKYCEACSVECVLVELTLTTDEFPQETSFFMTNSITDEILWSVLTTDLERFTTYEYTALVCPTSCHEFEFRDNYGDGIDSPGGFSFYYQGELYLDDGDASFNQLSVTFGDLDNCPNFFDQFDPVTESLCFSGNMEVVVQGKGRVSMETLQVGDFVKIGNGEVYEQVYAFGHRDPEKYAEFVQLHTNVGTTLEMTGQHLVFVDGKTNPVRADSIKVGDVLQAGGNNAVVEKIELVAMNGIYNPLTSSGTIEVNGITASNYISFQKENNEYIQFQGGIEIMSHHDAAHVAMTPYRFYCTTLAICDINDANSFIPLYVSMGIELIEWSKQQHILVQLFMYTSFRMLLLASILMACAALLIPAYFVSCSSIFQMQRVISHFSTIGVSLEKGLKMKKEK